MSDRTSKLKQELLLPGEHGWQLWTSTATTTFSKANEFDFTPGAFESANAKHTLALPASALWVLPAWLKGDTAHQRDMAQLHLDRLQVRTPGHPESLHVVSVIDEAEAHLARIVALKDLPTPLSDFRTLPDECRMSATCYPLPSDAITIWRELGKLVIAITMGPRLVYFSPLSSVALDHNALAELNNICLQLTFQKVLTSLSGIVLWADDGDLQRIKQTTGLDVSRQDKPAPRLTGDASPLMPQDVILTRQSIVASGRRRTMLLGIGFMVAALVATFSFLMGVATRERDALREKIADITPRASKVASHQAQWMEVASAVDPEHFPMELLLRCMEPKSAADVALMSFECTRDRIVLQGRTAEISPAFKYTEDIRNSDALIAYTWEPSTPAINATDSSATFQLSGSLSQTEEKP